MKTFYNTTLWVTKYLLGLEFSIAHLWLFMFCLSVFEGGQALLAIAIMLVGILFIAILDIFVEGKDYK